jgi:hypothetical protein
MTGINAVLAAVLAAVLGAQPPGTNTYRFQLTITGPLGHENVPMDQVLDFGALIPAAKLDGGLERKNRWRQSSWPWQRISKNVAKSGDSRSRN